MSLKIIQQKKKEIRQVENKKWRIRSATSSLGTYYILTVIFVNGVMRNKASCQANFLLAILHIYLYV